LVFDSAPYILGGPVALLPSQAEWRKEKPRDRWERLRGENMTVDASLPSMEDTMRQPALDPSLLHLLIDALPNAVLRPLLLSLLGAAPAAAPAPAPSRKRRGWPKGRKRGPRKAVADQLVDTLAAVDARRAATLARRREKEAAQRQAKRAAAKGKAGNGAAADAEKLWRRAETLAPGKPWRAIVREFGTNEAAAVDAHRNKTVPPGIVSSAIERFLDLPAV
jgi:hypothetical protein